MCPSLARSFPRTEKDRVENIVREKEPIDSDGGSLSKAEEYLSGKTMGILAGAPR
ncbi:hypothetical protein K0M31_007293 [Melipona bicolor]|uniref:Uncharacterized protein n=1 Tax=Melipona bicolor TaxID=60889 RepID=A0AA40GB49_9HYME|nr:hypothetical protein K0M31_007293 [Melipona bicolor]